MADSNERIANSHDTATTSTPTAAGSAFGGSSAQPAPGGKRSQSVLILGAFILIVGGILLALQMFVARRLPELTEARFEAAQALWEKNGPASYDMNVNVTGAQPGRVRIEVRDGKPTNMTRDDAAPPERTWETWTVPGMFQMLVDEFALRDDPNHKGQGAPGAEIWLRCDFDSKYGFPRTYQRIMTGGGPQIEWHVTSFDPK